MSEGVIIFKRHPYEEPHLIELEISASNGPYSGSTKIFMDASELGVIGDALQKFPTKPDDSYVWEYGEKEDQDDFFSLRVVSDGSGRCRIFLELAAHEGRAEFWMEEIYPAELAKLGKALKQFQQLEHLELQWNSDGNFELFKEYN